MAKKKEGTGKEVVKKIVAVADTMQQDIKKLKQPQIKIPLRSLSNVEYSGKEGYFKLLPGVKERTLTASTIKTFAQTLRMMALSKQLLETDDIATKREAYYVSKNWGEARFLEQPESDNVMDDIEAMMTVNREQIGFIPEEKGGDIASADPLSVGEGGFFHVTGVTTITDIDFGTDKTGRKVILVFDGALILTHNATSLILPTGANITTAAGDVAVFVSEGTDNVRCVLYMRKDGTPLAGGSGAHGASDHNDRTRHLHLNLYDATNASALPDSDNHGSLGVMPHWDLANAALTTLRQFFGVHYPLDLVTGTVTIKVLFSSSAAGDNIVCDFFVREYADGDTADATVLSGNITQACPAVANTLETVSATYTATAGQMVAAAFSRTGADAGDTNTGTVSVWGMWIEYTADS